MAISPLNRRAPINRRVLLAGLAATSLLPAQTPRYQPKQSDRPQVSTTDEEGFKPIFNGQSLAGWDGNPAYWRVQDGAIVGEITPETIIKSNTFIVWQGGSPGDFELKLEYRITPNGNSGINYRSMMIPDAVTPTNKFAMRGYQCDIDGANRYTGQNYEEKGRLFLAMRGQMTRIRGTQPPLVISSLGDPAELATKSPPPGTPYTSSCEATP